MTVKYIIEAVVIAALFIGLVNEEKVAAWEKKVIKKIKDRFNLGTDAEFEARLRAERFEKQQRMREAELLELGCNLSPSLKIVDKHDAA